MLGVHGGHDSSYVEIQCEGGKRSPQIDVEDKRAGVSNYFVGRDSRKWRSDIPQFGRVRYRDVYPGIDLVFYGGPANLEYDFDLAPGADPSRIRLAFVGARQVRLDADGGLTVETSGAQLRNLPPRITQNGARVGGHWTLRGKNRAGFVTDRFDRSKPLIIDPVLTYATYLGGAVPETTGEAVVSHVNGIAVDPQGNIIAGGQTVALDFPAKNSLYNSLPRGSGTTGFLTKINPSLSGSASLVYSTFFNVTGINNGGGAINAVAVDGTGNVYFTGTTGDNLPVVNPLPNQSALTVTGCAAILNGQPTPNSACYHAFIAELSAAGNKLLFCSYLGGSQQDAGFGVAVDAKGNIFVAGATNSFDFPIAGNFVQSGLNGGSQTGFVSMISPSRALVYSTNFGSGGGPDYVREVAADSSGRIFIAGIAGSTNLPLTGGFPYPGGSKLPAAAFAAVLNPSKQPSLTYSTYLGGSDFNSGALGVATDGAGNIYLAGISQATNFPVTSSAVRGPGGGINPKTFVTKLNPSAQGNAQLAYSTMLGGSYVDQAQAIAVDSTGRITVAGFTTSPNFEITANALQSQYVGSVVNSQFTPIGFLAQIDPTLSGPASLIYSSFVGGGGVNGGGSALFAVALDGTGKIAAAGGGSTAGAPVPSGYQTAFLGSGDAYIARFDMSQTGPLLSKIENAASLSADPNGTMSPGMIVTLKGTGLGPTVATNGIIDPTSGKVSTSAAGVQVLIDNVPCPLLYLSATQINAIAPYELASKRNQAVTVQVIYNQVPGNILYEVVNLTNPGIFSFDDGSGQGAILNQDGTVNGASNPAARGSLIQIFATGEGQTAPPGVDGAIANEPLGNIPAPAASVSVFIGGVQVPSSAITYAGTLPGGVAGALQINATVPANAPTGSAVSIVLTIGQNSSPKGLTMAIQ